MCEEPDFCNETERTARKKYRCCECGETIPPGEKYIYWVGKWNGEIDSYKWCKACRAFVNDLRKEGIELNDCGGWTFTMLWDEVFNYGDDMSDFPRANMPQNILYRMHEKELEDMQNRCGICGAHYWCRCEGNEGVSLGSVVDYYESLKRLNKPVPPPYTLNKEAAERRQTA